MKLLLLFVILTVASLSADPVTWHPWGEDAFRKAQAENKPIFVSVGYRTCHWCAVMERESFSDPEIAKLMDEAFVSIKVDRDERPDLESVYRKVTHTLLGTAGLPNNVILTPDGEPFFAMPYVTRDQFREAIPAIQRLWTTQRGQVFGTASSTMEALRAAPPLGDALGADVVHLGYRQLAARYDVTNGGFLPTPKFPMPHQLMFLLRYWQRTGEARALRMVETTLGTMRRSALWDARDRGFHRYADDADWSGPHREKTLYDQAMFALAYLEAYQATGKREYAQTSREIFAYVLCDLRSAEGTFFAGQDAAKVRDERIMTSWNGLMIAALAYGAAVLDEPKYAAAATRAAEVMLARPKRFLDDHAVLVWGLLNLYETTFEVKWLQSAIALEEETLTRFRDTAGRFYITASDGEPLLIPPRESMDGHRPSGNSVQLMNLIRLARMTANPKYENYATQLRRAVAEDVILAPDQATHLLSGIVFAIGPSLEVVIAGENVRAMRRAVFTPFAPNKVVIHRPAGEGAPIVEIAPFTADKSPVGRKAAAYVCANYVCNPATTDVKKVRGQVSTSAVGSGLSPSGSSR